MSQGPPPAPSGRSARWAGWWERSWAPRRRAVTAAVLGAVVAGIALRVWLLVLSTGAFDSDEAVVGLVARHALYDGELSTFFWGQFYGGTLEPLLSVPLFLVFGAAPWTVKAVPMVLLAVSAVLVWRLGRATIGEPAAAVAGAAFFAWPANLVWISTKGRGFYGVTMVVGLSLLLCAARLARRPECRRDWVLFGFLGGLGLWTSPLVLYFAVPAVIWVAARAPRSVWRAVYAVPAAVLGALPWLLFNLDHGFPSLERPVGFVTDMGWAGNTELLLRQGIPVALGLHAGERWLGPPVLLKAVYVAVVAVTAVLVGRRLRGAGLVLLHAACFVALWGIFPSSGVIGEGRYLLPLAPALALLLAHAARQVRAEAALLAGVVALSVAGVVRIADITEPFAGDVRTPRHLGPLVTFLEDRGIDRVYADYWVAYRLSFESRERIIATPADGSARYLPHLEAVDRSARPAYVFPAGGSEEARFGRGLARLGIPAERHEPGDFVVYRPPRRVGWDEVLAAGDRPG